MPPPPELDPFILLARSARGRAAAELVLKATAAPGVFVFGELLDEPNVAEVGGGGRGGGGEKGIRPMPPPPPLTVDPPDLLSPLCPFQLKNGDLAPYHAMLELFAYGTWADYRGEAGRGGGRLGLLGGGDRGKLPCSLVPLPRPPLLPPKQPPPPPSPPSPTPTPPS